MWPLTLKFEKVTGLFLKIEFDIKPCDIRITLSNTTWVVSQNLQVTWEHLRGNVVHGSLKPISHQNANSFVLEPCIGLDPQRDNFALPLPTCWYPKPLGPI